MNKRQAKKQFKKEYGCNPDEFMVNFESVLEDVSKMCNDICEALPKVIDSMLEVIRGVNEYVQSDDFKKIAQAVSELAKEKEPPTIYDPLFEEEMVKRIIEHAALGEKMRGGNNDQM